MTKKEYTDLVLRACNLTSQIAVEGMRKLLAEAALIKPYMSQAEAFRIYGRRTVETWAKEERITKIRDGGGVKYFVHELNAACTRGPLDAIFDKLKSLS